MIQQCPQSLTSIVSFFHHLSPEKLNTLGDYYAPAVVFQDPLHRIQGLAMLRSVYDRLFTQLDDVKIQVNDAHGDDQTGFILWSMHYSLRNKPRVIHGTSYLKFAPDGRVANQHDYWDASFPVYGESPLIGWAMHKIRKQSGFRSPS